MLTLIVITSLIDKLNDKFQLTGFRPVEQSSNIHPYINLIHNLSKKGQTEFIKDDLLHWCQRENLWLGINNTPTSAIPIGIRSFFRRTENMEDETKNMRCLLKYFEGRFIKENRGWHDIYLELDEFLSSTTNNNIHTICI